MKYKVTRNKTFHGKNNKKNIISLEKLNETSYFRAKLKRIGKRYNLQVHRYN